MRRAGIGVLLVAVCSPRPRAYASALVRACLSPPTRPHERAYLAACLATDRARATLWARQARLCWYRLVEAVESARLARLDAGASNGDRGRPAAEVVDRVGNGNGGGA